MRKNVGAVRTTIEKYDECLHLFAEFLALHKLCTALNKMKVSKLKIAIQFLRPDSTKRNNEFKLSGNRGDLQEWAKTLAQHASLYGYPKCPPAPSDK